jgi:transcriptional regulator with PAS, ATPase and Fis domain
VFLDEIGEMSPTLQAKLLRVLEEKAFRRVGGSSDVHVDVRVIAATNQDLEEAVKKGAFREDLYYRLNVLRVEMPALRMRGDDVSLLAQHFVETYSREFNRPVRSLSRSTESAFRAYHWPGNVRELRNLIERAVLLSDREVLDPSDFDTLRGDRPRTKSANGGFDLPAEGVNLEDVERSFVVQALERTNGNQTKAAALLGLHRDQIRYRVEKFGLTQKAATRQS